MQASPLFVLYYKLNKTFQSLARNMNWSIAHYLQSSGFELHNSISCPYRVRARDNIFRSVAKGTVYIHYTILSPLNSSAETRLVNGLCLWPPPCLWQTLDFKCWFYSTYTILTYTMLWIKKLFTLQFTLWYFIISKSSFPKWRNKNTH